MDVKVLSKEKNSIEIEFVGADQSLLQMLADKLNQDGDVEFAACKVEHPLIRSPKLILRTKKKEAAKLLLETLGSAKADIQEFRSKFSETVK